MQHPWKSARQVSRVHQRRCRLPCSRVTPRRPPRTPQTLPPPTATITTAAPHVLPRLETIVSKLLLLLKLLFKLPLRMLLLLVLQLMPHCRGRIEATHAARNTPTARSPNAHAAAPHCRHATSSSSTSRRAKHSSQTANLQQTPAPWPPANVHAHPPHSHTPHSTHKCELEQSL